MWHKADTDLVDVDGAGTASLDLHLVSLVQSVMQTEQTLTSTGYGIL